MEQLASVVVLFVLLCLCQGQASVHVDVDVDVRVDQRNIRREGTLGKPRITDNKDKDGLVLHTPHSSAQLLHEYSLGEDTPKPKEKNSSQIDESNQLSSMMHQILSLALKMEDRLDSLEIAVSNIESVSNETETKVRAFGEIIDKHVKRVEKSVGIKIEIARDQLTKLHQRDQANTENNSFCNVTENIIELMQNKMSLFEDSFGLLRESFSDQLNSSAASFNHLIRAQTQNFQSTLENKVSNAMLGLSSLINSTLKINQDERKIQNPKSTNVSYSSDKNRTQVVDGSEIARETDHTDFPKPNACRKGAIDLASSNLSTYVVIPKNESGDIGSAYLCDQVTDGGGWIVIQRRINRDVDFYKHWTEYKQGFGELSGDFWLGNDLIHEITANEDFELRVELSQNIRHAYAHYNQFYIEDESNRYALHVGGYSGTAGDSLSDHDGFKFSTWDKNTDEAPTCAYTNIGAWWYKDCYSSDLNSMGTGWTSGPKWNAFSFAKIETTEMKIRRIE